MEGYAADWALDTLTDIFKPEIVGKYFMAADQITDEHVKEVAGKYEVWT